jgi:hypothetical protein
VAAALLMLLLRPHGTAGAAPDLCVELPDVARVMALDAESKGTQAFEDERELRSFALFAYRSIAADIIGGHGAYLAALQDIFGPICASRPVLVTWLREMLSQSQSAADFSRRLAVAHAAAFARDRDHRASAQ